MATVVAEAAADAAAFEVAVGKLAAMAERDGQAAVQVVRSTQP